jgi:hypothetical protein
MSDAGWLILALAAAVVAAWLWVKRERWVMRRRERRRRREG